MEHHEQGEIMEHQKHYEVAYRFANAKPYKKGRFVGCTPFISRSKTHARILPVEYGEPIVFRFHATDILTIYPDGRFNVDYGGYSRAPTTRKALSVAASRCGFNIKTCSSGDKEAKRSVMSVGAHYKMRNSYRIARGVMEFDSEFRLLSKEGPLPEVVTNKDKLAALRESLEPFMTFAALVFETASGNIGYVSTDGAIRIAQDTNRADEWEAVVAYLKRHSVGYDRWGVPKRKCTHAIFKSFIAKTTLKMCKETHWVQP